MSDQLETKRAQCLWERRNLPFSRLTGEMREAVDAIEMEMEMERIRTLICGDEGAKG